MSTQASRPMYYFLDGEIPKPIPGDNVLAWAQQLENEPQRRVAETTIGPSYVSTVFLGLDHNYGDGPPILFETMIFGGRHDGYQERYATWDGAVAGHARAVRLATPGWHQIGAWLRSIAHKAQRRGR